MKIIERCTRIVIQRKELLHSTFFLFYFKGDYLCGLKHLHLAYCFFFIKGDNLSYFNIKGDKVSCYQQLTLSPLI